VRLPEAIETKAPKRNKKFMTKLYLVSSGPGHRDFVSPRATAAINASTDVVAYGLYLQLLGELCDKKTHHDLPLGQEIDRARLSLDLAASGKTTSLVSSGDIGIYAMATLVFELLDEQLKGNENHLEWLDVEIEVVPGISAMQAASSRAGAMLGHDFCTISLSDLLTPWQTIEKRLHACGEGDFVVSFYNPRSVKRDWQINIARDILLKYRPASTPTILGKHLTREKESITVITLGELDSNNVDMFTLVSVGNSESKHIAYGDQEWVYTPRGYSKKL